MPDNNSMIMTNKGLDGSTNSNKDQDENCTVSGLDPTLCEKELTKNNKICDEKLRSYTRFVKSTIINRKLSTMK